MELAGKPGFQIVEDHFGFGLADLCSYVRRRAPNLLLNGVDIGDPFYRFLSDGRPWALCTSTNLRRTCAMHATSLIRPVRYRPSKPA